MTNKDREESLTVKDKNIDPRERQCYYDETGMEIGEGDLLQVYHFRHYWRRMKMYMYQVAVLQEIKGTYWWSAKDYDRCGDKGHYLLKAVADKETGVIPGTRIIHTIDYDQFEKRKAASYARKYNLKLVP